MNVGKHQHNHKKPPEGGTQNEGGTRDAATYNVSDVIEVEIKKIVPKGFGLGFVEGLTVFVPLTAPGDKLVVRLAEIKGKTAFAEIEKIIESSTQRIEPPCVYFGQCGGCNFQQMNYGAQLAAKVGIIRDCLHRIGKIEYEKEIEIVPSPRELRYRSRAQWHVDSRERTIGYYRRLTHEVIDVKECPILVPELEAALNDTRANLDWSRVGSSRFEVYAAAGSDGKISKYSPEIFEPTNEVVLNALGEKYFYSAKSFFQGNPFLVEPLVKAAIDGASGRTALDLFSGVGLFTLPLARNFGQVVAVEDHDIAVEFAEKNVSRAGLGNVRLVHESVDKFIGSLDGEAIDFVLLDPPRAGAKPVTVKRLASLKPKQVSFVSCEPSTLARDLRIFIDHGYVLDSIVAFDLFPQTHHVETIVKLKAQGT